ncbi:hypothetical protein [Salinibaculum rarum]|uniref:hypothetical protein n=1 Tax=Salinibaculum rarum TaxID=3058903 RepID=UPI00265FB56C|nr:hypothetical protein [Salinibaculum sp. KK48]
MSSANRSTDSCIANQLSIEVILEALPAWDVAYSKHPLKQRERITFTADIGVLEHSVEVVPRFNAPTGKQDGWRVQWHTEAYDDAKIIERRLLSLDDALQAARDQMAHLEE